MSEVSPAYNRLRYLVGVMCEPMETTRGGISKPKTKKQREIERIVAEEVVRFAFDHANLPEAADQIAPTGFLLKIMNECGNYRLASFDPRND